MSFDSFFLLSSLSPSQRRAVRPLSFVRALRDWEGNPVSLKQQQDAYEFFALLTEQLEPVTPPSPYPLSEQRRLEVWVLSTPVFLHRNS